MFPGTVGVSVQKGGPSAAASANAGESIATMMACNRNFSAIPLFTRPHAEMSRPASKLFSNGWRLELSRKRPLCPEFPSKEPRGGVYDTHPPLKERLAAVGQTPPRPFLA